MSQIMCPLDGRPCEKDCPDRYRDRPDGGCTLTTLLELGGAVLTITPHTITPDTIMPTQKKGATKHD